MGSENEPFAGDPEFISAAGLGEIAIISYFTDDSINILLNIVNISPFKFLCLPDGTTEIFDTIRLNSFREIEFGRFSIPIRIKVRFVRLFQFRGNMQDSIFVIEGGTQADDCSTSDLGMLDFVSRGKHNHAAESWNYGRMIIAHKEGHLSKFDEFFSENNIAFDDKFLNEYVEKRLM